MLTNLIAYDNNSGLYWIDDVPGAVEALFHNVTLSLMTLDYNQTIDVPCLLSRDVIVFAYRSTPLLIAYGSAIAASLLCILIGSFVMWRNAFGGANGFKAFLTTTRNPKLDHSNIDGKKKLRYGTLRGTGGLQKAFAQEEDLVHENAVDVHAERAPFLG